MISGRHHSIEDDFENFLAHTGYGALYEGQHGVLAHLRMAHEHSNPPGMHDAS